VKGISRDQAQHKEGKAMLVLSRKRNEGVVIGQDIEVIILAVHGDHVKLGFRATDGVSIHREEVYQRIQREHADQAGYA
jgi:carbon storage regulator